MKIHRLTVLLAVAVGVASTSLVAQAQEVYWSLGWSAPGVQLGLSNALPVFVQPRYQPIVRRPLVPIVEYEQAYPVPGAVRVGPPPWVYVQPAVVYGAPLQYTEPNWRDAQRAGNWRHRHERHEQWRRHHEREERRD